MPVPAESTQSTSARHAVVELPAGAKSTAGHRDVGDSLSEPSTAAGLATTAQPTGTQPDLIGLLGVASAGLLPIVLFDDLYWGTWAPKAAICLGLLLPGLVVLARLVLAGSRAALLATGFLGVAAISTATSDSPPLSLVGAANWGTGLLFLCALAGAWALGVVAGGRRRRQLLLVIIGAVVVNAVVAWGQAHIGGGGRTRGLLGNPVFLGAFAAAGLYLLGRRFGRERRSWWWLAAVTVVAGAVQLSGGRSAALLAGVAVLASLRGAGLSRGAALVAAVAVGALVAPIGAKDPILASSRSAPAAAVSRGDTRFAVWRVSVGAVADRPLLGWGPGRFPAATGPRYDATAGQEGVVLKDAHNWVVEHAVTTGGLGLALLLGWLGTAARRAEGPFAGFALIVGASTLVQPMHVALTPMAMLALGAADGTGAHLARLGQLLGDQRGSADAPLGRRWGLATGIGMCIGLALSAVLLLGQFHLRHGLQAESRPEVQRANRLSPPWPEVELVAASVEAEFGLRASEPSRRRTLEHTRRAVQRDPADPALWAELGAVELQWGSNERAAAAFGRALEANPWDIRSLLGRVTLARRLRDEAALADACRRLRAVDRRPDSCSHEGP